MKKSKMIDEDTIPKYFGKLGVSFCSEFMPTKNASSLNVFRFQTLDGICNAVMSDQRVFHIDCTDWIDKFNQQGWPNF